MPKDTDSEWNDLASEYRDGAPIPDDDDIDLPENRCDEPGLRRKFVGIDPNDASGLAGELEAAVTRLTDDLSELAKVMTLPYAKGLYEELHPETKHGGIRDEQSAKPATWPCFAVYVAQRTGFSERTIYNRLKTAEQLATLDEKTVMACYCSPIANQLPLLARIAKLPQSSLQRDVVAIYNCAGPKKAKAVLRKQEGELGLQRQPKPRHRFEPETPAKSPNGTEESASQGMPDGRHVRAIIEALGVNGIDECVPAIDSLKASRSAEHLHPVQNTIQDLQEQLAEAEARTTNLSQELKVYRTTPLGKLFQILGARDAKGAFEKARALTASCEASLEVSK